MGNKPDNKLTYEEKDLLRPLMSDSRVWKPLMKVMRELEQSYIDSVIQYDLNSGSQGLVIKKARVEGIQDFLINLDHVRKDMISPGGKNG